MQQRKLLLIDDDKFWVNTTATLLRGQDYEVFTAATCAEGFCKAKTCRPDCILLDFELPDMDGGMFAFNLRADVKLGKTPIIMVTGSAEKEAKAIHEFQVDGFFIKGDQIGRLHLKVESILRRVAWERDVIAHKDLSLNGTSLQVSHHAKHVATLSREQFRLLSLLISRTPNFVEETSVIQHVFGGACETDYCDAVKMLAYRLRLKLGPELAMRIRRIKDRGWIYLPPQTKIPTA